MREISETALFKVVIADPQPLFRVGLAHVLTQQSEFEVVGACASPADALRLVATEMPDFLFLDVINGGVQTLREAKQLARKPLRVIFITNSESQTDVTAALRAGASGYMLRTIAPEMLIQTLRKMHTGEIYVTPQLVTSLLTSGSTEATSTHLVDTKLRSLSPREQEILRELGRGQTNREIARRLNLSEKTVKNCMGRVLKKLCVRNRTEAVIVSQRRAAQPGINTPTSEAALPSGFVGGSNS